MPDTKTNHYFAYVFAQISKAAARKKIYSRKAARDGRPEIAHFLRAMAESEAIQARRLFNSMFGPVDTSDDYLTTIFEKEVNDLLESYSELITYATAKRPVLLQALYQLRAAETRLRSFYSLDKKDADLKKDSRYFVCRFCGYLSPNRAPGKCPVCGALTDAFLETN